MTQFKNSLYDYSNAATINDVLPLEFCQSLQIQASQVQAKYKNGKRVKRQYVQKIFYDFLKLIIDECMQKNVCFISPTVPYFAIYIKKKMDWETGRILKRGKTYNNVDLIESDCLIYEFVFFMNLRKGIGRNANPLNRLKRYRAIRIGHTKYMELIDRVNKGQRYY